jgi:hypothetical protein
MSINEILKNEQITLMRHAAETDPIESKKHRRKLSMFERVLSAHPYSHRPYSRQNIVEKPSAPALATRSPALSAWENEGGAS